MSSGIGINGLNFMTPKDKFLTKGEPAMKARIDYTNVPEALRGMYQLEHYIHNSGLEGSVVKSRSLNALKYYHPWWYIYRGDRYA